MEFLRKAHEQLSLSRHYTMSARIASALGAVLILFALWYRLPPRARPSKSAEVAPITITPALGGHAGAATPAAPATAVAMPSATPVPRNILLEWHPSEAEVAKAVNTKVLFYGKVVAQFGRPVPNA